MQSFDVLIHLAEVKAMTGISKATIYRWTKTGKFPAPAKISGTARWSRTEVNEWIKQMLERRTTRAYKMVE